MNTKFLFLIGTLALSVAAYADSQSNTTSSDQKQTSDPQSRTSSDSQSRTPTSQTQNAQDMSPKDVCKTLIDNQKNNVADSQFDKWVLQGSKMKGQSKSAIKRVLSMDSDCNSETIAGNHAIVVVKSAGQEQFLPFVRQNNMWKLDLAAHHALYRLDARMPASQDKVEHSKDMNKDMNSDSSMEHKTE